MNIFINNVSLKSPSLSVPDTFSIRMYRSHITITLRPSILDVQGKAVEQGIHTLGMKEVQNVRIGKSIHMTLDVPTEDDAKRITEEACKKLLANTVMEDYAFTVTKL